MRTFVTAFAFVTILACTMAPSAAQPAAAAQSPVENCLALAADDFAAQRACIGQASAWCIENTPGGESTVGTIECARAERLQWESVRTAQAIALRAHESASQVSLLDAALAESERWAGAHCAYRASVYEGGSLSRVIAAICMRDVVAEQALYLRNRYSED